MRINISYKISINYCSINTQIIIILRKKFKCSTVISVFSEHIIIFRTISIDIWQLKCQQRNENIISELKSRKWNEMVKFLLFIFILFWVIKRHWAFSLLEWLGKSILELIPEKKYIYHFVLFFLESWPT